MTAWVGVALTHIVSKRYDELLGGEFPYHSNQVPNYNPSGLLAWFAGAGAGLFMTLSGFGAAYAPVATFIVSVAVYYGMLQVARREWFVIES